MTFYSGGWGRSIDSEGLMTVERPLLYALLPLCLLRAGCGYAKRPRLTENVKSA